MELLSNSWLGLVHEIYRLFWQHSGFSCKKPRANFLSGLATKNRVLALGLIHLSLSCVVLILTTINYEYVFLQLLVCQLASEIFYVASHVHFRADIAQVCFTLSAGYLISSLSFTFVIEPKLHTISPFSRGRRERKRLTLNRWTKPKQSHGLDYWFSHSFVLHFFMPG